MQDYSNLDYSALDDKTVSYKDFTKEQLMTAGLDTSIIRWLPSLLIIVMAGFSGVALLRLVMTVVEHGGNFGIFDVFDTVIGLFIAAVLLVWFVISRSNQKQQLRNLKFALDNGSYYNIAKTLPPTDPILFNVGNNQRQVETLLFPDGLMLAKYQYTIGSGDKKRTCSFNFAQIKLPRSVPHLFLDAKGNFIRPEIENYSVQKLHLEGDFSKHFNLYAPPNYHVDALQILTPDVMSALMDFGRNYDFELIGDELYVYHHGNMGIMPSFSGTVFDSGDKLKKFLMSVSQISHRLGKQVKTYSDTRAGNIASGLVATEGARLKKRFPVVPAIMMAVAFTIYFIMTLL